ncbi:transposase [Paenibacillus sp. TY11]|uniref:transposase n=1 Tax=Paenibacillus sp. TY11 TaxID=3448633 RepID=UPI004039B2CD
MGHSRGGLSTKIHGVVDALGNPLRFELTGRQAHDSVKGYDLLRTMKLTKKQVLADRAYGTNAIRCSYRKTAGDSGHPEQEESPCSSGI